MQATAAAQQRTGISLAEVAKFDALAATWWDRRGPMRELHRMNPLRTGWVAARVAQRFGAVGVRTLDVGCGAGIAAESFAAMGHKVLGLDAAPAAIAAARVHAATTGSSATYRVGTAEELQAEGQRFQVVTALEVIEHVPDPAAFLTVLASLLEPGGLLFISTLNRTLRSFAVAIVGAEHVARLVPRGTHDWRRFVTPAELSRHLRAAGMRLADLSGMVPDLSAGAWRLSRDSGVNYIAMAEAATMRVRPAADTIRPETQA